MKSKCIIFSLLLALLGCAGTQVDSTKTTHAPSIEPPFSIEKLSGARVRELFVVIFEKDFSTAEWTEIFKSTNELSLNKKKLRFIEGKLDNDSQTLRASLIGKNAALLTFLSAKSLFMLSFTSQDENCKISKQGFLMKCKPFNFDNPLNGGLPTSSDPLTWVIPDSVRSDTRDVYLQMHLEHSLDANGAHYGLKLRLNLENKTDQETWMKGDALPDAGSVFKKTDGSLSQGFYPYGYSELTLN